MDEWAVIFNQSCLLESPHHRSPLVGGQEAKLFAVVALMKTVCSSQMTAAAGDRYIRAVVVAVPASQRLAGCPRSFTLSSDRKRLSHRLLISGVYCVKVGAARKTGLFIIEFIQRRGEHTGHYSSGRAVAVVAAGQGICVLLWFTLRYHKHI